MTGTKKFPRRAGSNVTASPHYDIWCIEVRASAVRCRGKELCSAPFAFWCRAQFLYSAVSADLLNIQDTDSFLILRDSPPDLKGTNVPLTGKSQ